MHQHPHSLPTALQIGAAAAAAAVEIVADVDSSPALAVETLAVETLAAHLAAAVVAVAAVGTFVAAAADTDCNTAAVRPTLRRQAASRCTAQRPAQRRAPDAVCARGD